jgi:hypothetical protein
MFGVSRSGVRILICFACPCAVGIFLLNQHGLIWALLPAIATIFVCKTVHEFDAFEVSISTFLESSLVTAAIVLSAKNMTPTSVWILFALYAATIPVGIVLWLLSTSGHKKVASR